MGQVEDSIERQIFSFADSRVVKSWQVENAS